MNKGRQFAFALTVGLGVVLGSLSGAVLAQAPVKKPNVVMLMSDDTGWTDLGAYLGGAALGHPTPNLDRIAREGAMFTSWYGQASCTAGRASFITGRIPIRSALSVVVVPGDPNGLRKETPTIAEFYQKNGYSTYFSGKWHLGDKPEFYPIEHGFDEMKHGTPQAAVDKKPNDAIALLAVLVGTPPKKVVVNEFSTIASVWSSAQFLKGEVLSGTKLGLHIAAGNVPNLVDLATGSLGPVIQDPLNSSQTATLATFNTLGDLLAGCITRVHADACSKLFAAATPPGGAAPTDTLTAAQNIARNPSHQAQQLFALLEAFYPVPAGKRLRQIVYLPKGDATKGRILGRTVKGKPVDGTLQVKGPFHLAVDQQDRIWVTGNPNTVTRFPASDPGKAEQIKVGYGPRAIAIDSLGNAWVANTLGHPDTAEKLKLVEEALASKVEGRFESAAAKADAVPQMWIDLYDLLTKFPGGNVSMVRPDGTVLPPFDGGKSINGPWGIAVDGNDNVWVANGFGHTVTALCGTRPANCPPGTKTGDPISPPGGFIGGMQAAITDVAIDPAGNVWVANNWDLPSEGFKKVPDPALATRFGGNGVVVFFGLAKPVRTPLIGPPRAP